MKEVNRYLVEQAERATVRQEPGVSVVKAKHAGTGRLITKRSGC